MGSAGRTQKVLVKSAKSTGGGGRTGALGALLEGGGLSAGKCSSVRSLGELPADPPGGRTAGERGEQQTRERGGRVQDAQRVKDSIVAAKGGSVQTPAPCDLDVERISESGSLTLLICEMGTATVPPRWQGSNKSSECDPGMKGH